jgi:hypothetical protein
MAVRILPNTGKSIDFADQNFMHDHALSQTLDGDLKLTDLKNTYQALDNIRHAIGGTQRVDVGFAAYSGQDVASLITALDPKVVVMQNNQPFGSFDGIEDPSQTREERLERALGNSAYGTIFKHFNDSDAESSVGPEIVNHAITAHLRMGNRLAEEPRIFDWSMDRDDNIVVGAADPQSAQHCIFLRVIRKNDPNLIEDQIIFHHHLELLTHLNAETSRASDHAIAMKNSIVKNFSRSGKTILYMKGYPGVNKYLSRSNEGLRIHNEYVGVPGGYLGGIVSQESHLPNVEHSDAYLYEADNAMFEPMPYVLPAVSNSMHHQYVMDLEGTDATFGRSSKIHLYLKSPIADASILNYGLTHPLDDMNDEEHAVYLVAHFDRRRNLFDDGGLYYNERFPYSSEEE